MDKTRATRHNGRVGKKGIFKAGHNDRSFEVDNAEHIIKDRSYKNVYWDCYQGYNICDSDNKRPERKYNFDQIELLYYTQQFGDSITAQNNRHIESRHRERIRNVDQILKDPKTCPEETIYQLGTKDGFEDPEVFVEVVSEVMEEIGKRYGDHIQILDWSLHMDEATPHIHERHVFFADDGYGMTFPKQEKACEAMGFELPCPDKKPGKKNNRKMSFDEEIRRLYIEIAEKHGVTIEKVPLEGKEHLEKNDYIIAKQNEEITQKKAELDELVLKISDIETMIDEVADKAYEKACETVTKTVRETTHREDIKTVKEYKDFILSPEKKFTQGEKSFAGKLLDAVIGLLKRKSGELITKVKKALNNPEIKKKNMEEIASAARESIMGKLSKYKEMVDNESNGGCTLPIRQSQGKEI